MEGFFIDTHAHLYLPEFDEDRDLAVDRAMRSGVAKIMLPNIDSNSVVIMNQVCKQHSGTCFPMMGLHPTSVKDNFREEIDTVEAELKRGNYFAVGEIGIDMYWDTSRLSQQQEVFRIQLDLALEHDLPVAIHARESFVEIIEILNDYKGKGLKGVFHAFTGNYEIAHKITSMGFYLGIGGIITYKKSDLPNVIKDIPVGHLLLETDSPYLAPVPYRGKRNESSYIPAIAQVIQQIKDIPLEEVARITSQNAMNLFRLNAS